MASKVVGAQGSTATSFSIDDAVSTVDEPTLLSFEMPAGSAIMGILWESNGTVSSLSTAALGSRFGEVAKGARLASVGKVSVPRPSSALANERLLAAAATASKPYNVSFVNPIVATNVQVQPPACPLNEAANSGGEGDGAHTSRAVDEKHGEAVVATIRSICSVAGQAARILEIGIGEEFDNVPRYPPGTRVVGVDAVNRTAEEAADAAAIASAASVHLELVRGDVQRLPFPDGVFDGAVGVFVLCSVSDMSLAVAEISRVLRKGAAYGFVEHVRAPEGSALLGMQEHFEPAQISIADNCHLTRPIDKVLATAAGFAEVASMERFRVMKMWPVAEQCCGVLIK